ncbi:MAG: hypothetical protein K2X93_03790 [Candidatus Obscuribacterales bacterium]|nr:hypothetical protein [Candidatus Obscuribacterales bacterium]
MTKRLSALFCIFLLSVCPARATDVDNHKPDMEAQGLAGDLSLTEQKKEDELMLSVMKKELTRNFDKLKDLKPPVHFIAYRIYDAEASEVSSCYGSLFTRKNRVKDRYIQVEVRVGSSQLDSSHSTSGSLATSVDENSFREHCTTIDRNPLNLRTCLWLETEKQYRQAAEKYGHVVAEQGLTSDDKPCDDFSKEDPIATINNTKFSEFNLDTLESTVRKLSMIYKDYKDIETSWVKFDIDKNDRYFVNSEGTAIADHSMSTFFITGATATADDGERLRLDHQVYVPRPDKVEEATPDFEKATKKLAVNIVALKKSSPSEAYYGPAILNNRAAAVLFHEALGHRLEAHRLRRLYEGKTFENMMGKRILPTFITVDDKPLLTEVNGQPLVGHYNIDDEGVPAKNVTVVDSGTLRSFLLGRTPVADFPNSNGHGRCQPGGGYQPVARMGNLIVSSTKQVSEETLRQHLIDELKKQKKPYGLMVEEVVSGETNTSDFNPQSFHLSPSLVRKIYADGRPDELVRSVRIIGTPMAALERIVETSDKMGVFNGSCGAESGWVPQSNCAPSILVDGLETERTHPGKNVKPVLTPPDIE